MEHKCPRCGTAFDGNFCPECGEKWQEEKTCPNCGATLPGGARFCNNCGYSFGTEEPKKSQTPEAKQKPLLSDNMKRILYAVCRYLPAALLGLITLLNFLFFLAPAAVIPGGEILGQTIPSESYGNVYQISAFEGSSLPASLTALIVFNVFAVVAAAAALYFLFRPLPARKDAEKPPLPLSLICTAAGYLFVFVLFLISCIAMGLVGKDDGGMGIIAVGAALVLVLVFSLLCLLGGAAAIVGGYFLNKKVPEAKELFDEAVETRASEKAAAAAECRASLEEPQPPEKVERKPSPEPEAPKALEYRDCLTEEEREALKPEVDRHIKRKRKIALLGLPLLVVYVPLFLVALVIAAMKVDGWHPEKVYRHKSLANALIIVWTILFAGLIAFAASSSIFLLQSVAHYNDGGSVFESAGASALDQMFSTDDPEYMNGIVYDESGTSEGYDGGLIIDGDAYIIYKFEFDTGEQFYLDYLKDRTQNPYAADDPVISYILAHPESHVGTEFRYFMTVAGELVDREIGRSGLWVSTDCTNWVNVVTEADDNQFDVKEYLPDISTTLFVKITDAFDGTGEESYTYFNFLFGRASGTYRYSIPLLVYLEKDRTLIPFIAMCALAVVLLIWFIPTLVAYRKTIKQRKALAEKLCGYQHPKQNPELVEQYQKELEEYDLAHAAWEQEVREINEAKKAYRRALTVYRYQSHCYRKGKPYEAPYPKMWLFVHKFVLAGVALLLVVVIIVACAVGTADNRFKIGTVKQIAPGDSEQHVIDVLGQPFEVEFNDWVYYSKEYVSIAEEMEKLSNEAENSESLSDLENLEKKYEELEKELAGLTYRTIRISFSEGKVTLLVLNAEVSDLDLKEKVADSVTLSPDSIVRNSADISVTYAIEYTDGSYRTGYLSSLALAFVDISTPGTYEAAWSDQWGTYTAPITVK